MICNIKVGQTTKQYELKLSNADCFFLEKEIEAIIEDLGYDITTIVSDVEAASISGIKDQLLPDNETPIYTTNKNNNQCSVTKKIVPELAFIIRDILNNVPGSVARLIAYSNSDDFLTIDQKIEKAEEKCNSVNREDYEIARMIDSHDIKIINKSFDFKGVKEAFDRLEELKRTKQAGIEAEFNTADLKREYRFILSKLNLTLVKTTGEDQDGIKSIIPIDSDEPIEINMRDLVYGDTADRNKEI